MENLRILFKNIIILLYIDYSYLRILQYYYIPISFTFILLMSWNMIFTRDFTFRILLN